MKKLILYGLMFLVQSNPQSNPVVLCDNYGALTCWQNTDEPGLFKIKKFSLPDGRVLAAVGVSSVIFILLAKNWYKHGWVSKRQFDLAKNNIMQRFSNIDTAIGTMFTQVKNMQKQLDGIDTNISGLQKDIHRIEKTLLKFKKDAKQDSNKILGKLGAIEETLGRVEANQFNLNRSLQLPVVTEATSSMLASKSSAKKSAIKGIFRGLLGRPRND